MEAMEGPWFRPTPPLPTRMCPTPWLEPYPDMLLEQESDTCPGPEGISLAFVAALQQLPPLQRAALVLRDVLGFCAAETAEILESTADVVDGTVTRARAAMMQTVPEVDAREPPPAPGSPAECAVVRRLTEAYAAGDIDGVISLLTEDVWITMPPALFEYQGRELAAQLLALLFGRGRTYRLVPTRANGQPAFGIYARDPRCGLLRASGLMVVTLAGDRVCALHWFDTGSLARFGLPRTLEA